MRAGQLPALDYLRAASIISRGELPCLVRHSAASRDDLRVLQARPEVIRPASVMTTISDDDGTPR